MKRMKALPTHNVYPDALGEDGYNVAVATGSTGLVGITVTRPEGYSQLTISEKSARLLLAQLSYALGESNDK